MKKLRITVEGKAYEVLVETLESPAAAAGTGPLPPPPVVVAPAAPAARAATANLPGAVTSPLAGKVVTVQVQPGAEVKTGQSLVTIEAMKMNTYVNAHKDGKVAKIHVAAGDAVEEGQTLVTIE
jgi:biotin carboxyl carrier protein